MKTIQNQVDMERKEILQEIKKYFTVKELVCNHTYNKFGESSWQFLDTKALHTLLVLRRDLFKTPMVVNYSGHYQRGLRCNLCQLVKDKTNRNAVYLTAHILGKAFDISMKTITGAQARDMIKKNQDLLPYPVRIEKDVNWLHIDVRDTHNDNRKVIEVNG